MSSNCGVSPPRSFTWGQLTFDQLRYQRYVITPERHSYIHLNSSKSDADFFRNLLMRLLAQLRKSYYLYIPLGVDKTAPVKFYGVPRLFVSLLDPGIFIFVYMLTMISDTRSLYRYVLFSRYSILPSNHVVFMVNIEAELKNKFDEKKKKGSKG
jgi:hypothetical protein